MEIVKQLTFFKRNDASPTRICTERRCESSQNSGLAQLWAKTLIYERFFSEVSGDDDDDTTTTTTTTTSSTTTTTTTATATATAAISVSYTHLRAHET